MAQTPPWDETPLPGSLASVGESTPSAGWFRFHFHDERWEWSPEVEQMHGYEAGTTEPTTELLLSHKHPDDYAEVAEALEYVRRTHAAISTRHRIIDANGRTRNAPRRPTPSSRYTAAYSWRRTGARCRKSR